MHSIPALEPFGVHWVAEQHSCQEKDREKTGVDWKLEDERQPSSQRGSNDEVAAAIAHLS